MHNCVGARCTGWSYVHPHTCTLLLSPRGNTNPVLFCFVHVFFIAERVSTGYCV